MKSKTKKPTKAVKSSGLSVAVGSAFRREDRYLVFKRKDCELCMTDAQRTQLIELARVMWAYREAAGKPDFACVVVESDWPEYEPTWKAIEARMTSRGKPGCPWCGGTGVVIYTAGGDTRQDECGCVPPSPNKPDEERPAGRNS